MLLTCSGWTSSPDLPSALLCYHAVWSARLQAVADFPVHFCLAGWATAFSASPKVNTCSPWTVDKVRIIKHTHDGKLSEMTRSIKRDASESCTWVIKQVFEEELKARFLLVIQQSLLLHISSVLPLVQTFLCKHCRRLPASASLPCASCGLLPREKPAWITPGCSQRTKTVQAAVAWLAVIAAGVPAVLAPHCQVGYNSTEGLCGKDLLLQEGRNRLRWPGGDTLFNALSSLFLFLLPLPHTNENDFLGLSNLHIYSKTLPLR